MEESEQNWEDSDVDDGWFPDDALQVLDEQVESGMLRGGGREPQRKQQVRFGKVPASAGKKPGHGAWRESRRARACQRQEERTLKGSMSLQKLDLDMMVLDPRSLPVGGTPPCPSPLAAALLEGSSSRPPTPPLSIPSMSPPAPAAPILISCGSGWLEDSSKMAVDRLLPYRLRQVPFRDSKPTSTSYVSAAAAAGAAAAGSSEGPLGPTSSGGTEAAGTAQPDSAAATVAAALSQPAAAPAAAVPPAAEGLSLAPAGYSVRSAMGLPSRSQEEWQLLGLQDPEQVQRLVKEAATAAKDLTVQLNNMDTEVRALLGADTCWQALPQHLHLLRAGLNEGKALNQDLRQLLVAVLALQQPQQLLQTDDLGPDLPVAGAELQQVLMADPEPQPLGSMLLQQLEGAAMGLLAALRQLAGGVFLSCRRGLCEVKDEWDTAASSSGVAEAMRVCFHEAQQLIRVLLGLEDRCRFHQKEAWKGVQSASDSYGGAAEKIAQWVDIILVGIRDATMGMQRRVMQAPGSGPAADVVALLKQRQELVRAWQASGQLALMVSKELEGLQIKALQEQIKLLIWAGDRVGEVVRHYEQQLRLNSPAASGPPAAAAGGVFSGGDDNSSALVGRQRQPGLAEAPVLLSAPSLPSRRQSDTSDIPDQQQQQEQELGDLEGGPTAADVKDQEWVSQLLLELVKGAMRLHMVLLELLVARERQKASDREAAAQLRPALTPLQETLLWDLLHRAHHGFFTLAHANLRRMAALAAAPEQLPRSSQEALLRQSWKALLLFKLARQHDKYCFKAGACLGGAETQALLKGPLAAACSQVTQAMFRLRGILRPPNRMQPVAAGGNSNLAAAGAAGAAEGGTTVQPRGAAVPPSSATTAAAAAGGVSVLAVGGAVGRCSTRPPSSLGAPRALGSLAHDLRWVWEEVENEFERRQHKRFTWAQLGAELAPAGRVAAAEEERMPVQREMSLRRHGRWLGNGSYGHVYLGKLDGAEVAVKVMHQEDSLYRFLKEVLPDFKREVELMRSCLSDHVVAYRGCCCQLPPKMLAHLRSEQQQWLTDSQAAASRSTDHSGQGSLNSSSSSNGCCAPSPSGVTSGHGAASEPAVVVPSSSSNSSSGGGGSGTELKEQVEELWGKLIDVKVTDDLPYIPSERCRPSVTDEVRLGIIMERCNLGNLRNMLDAGAKVQSIYKVEARGNSYCTLDGIRLVTDHFQLHAARRLFEEWPLRLQVLKGVASGMECLHNNSIVHRDLASRNVLLCGSERSGDWTAKVCDLNLSRCMGAGTTAANTLSGLMFSRHYAAPERLGEAGKGCGPPADVFSLGVVLWEVLTMQPRDMLFDCDVMEVEEDSDPPPNVAGLPWPTEGDQLWVPAEDAAQLKALAHQCWRKDPAERITITQVRQQLEDMVAREAAREGGQAMQQRRAAFLKVLQAKEQAQSAAPAPHAPAAAAAAVAVQV